MPRWCTELVSRNSGYFTGRLVWENSRSELQVDRDIIKQKNLQSKTRSEMCVKVTYITKTMRIHTIHTTRQKP